MSLEPARFTQHVRGSSTQAFSTLKSKRTSQYSKPSGSWPHRPPTLSLSYRVLISRLLKARASSQRTKEMTRLLALQELKKPPKSWWFHNYLTAAVPEDKTRNARCEPTALIWRTKQKQQNPALQTNRRLLPLLNWIWAQSLKQEWIYRARPPMKKWKLRFKFSIFNLLGALHQSSSEPDSKISERLSLSKMCSGSSKLSAQRTRRPSD